MNEPLANQFSESEYPSLGTSDDLGLRPVTSSDATTIYLGWLDEAANVLGGDHLPKDLAELRKDIAIRHAPPENYLLAIELSNAHVGNISLHVDLRKQVAEVGIMVASEHRTHHVASRAHILLLDWVFGELHLRKVWAGHLQGNKAAAGLYRSLGFIQEGLLRKHDLINGIAHDVVRTGILKKDWQSQRIALERARNSS